MKRKFRNSVSLLLSAVMVLSFSFSAFAQTSSITFKGAEAGFEAAPGSEYTATDLFDNFKNVMPGDKLSESIELKNEAEDCDYINLYMKVLIHDENGNPITYDEAFENTDGKDFANVDGERDETVATMADFLSQLTMRIYNGEELIYEASPDKAGALIDNVLLGSLKNGEAISLTVELDVPIELGNRYANRVGEVDWVFLAECIEYEELTVKKVWNDRGDPKRPASVTVYLLKDGEIFEEITLNKANKWTYSWATLDDRYEWTVEELVPEGYEVSYKVEANKVTITNSNDYKPVNPPTGDSNDMMLYLLLLLGSIVAIALLFIFGKRSKKANK